MCVYVKCFLCTPLTSCQNNRTVGDLLWSLQINTTDCFPVIRKKQLQTANVLHCIKVNNVQSQCNNLMWFTLNVYFVRTLICQYYKTKKIQVMHLQISFFPTIC